MSYVKRRSIRTALILASVALFLLLVLRRQSYDFSPPTIVVSSTSDSTVQIAYDRPARASLAAVTMVVASLKKENTSWLGDLMPAWEKRIYVTDDTNALYTVPVNKGREGMVYLTYIMDNYDNLPEVMIFSHAGRYQWHNDDPLYDGKRMYSRLRVPFIHEQGYVNLRCVWTLGCPDEIHPLTEQGATLPGADGSSSETRAGSYYKIAFQILFPEQPVPEAVGASCCAQFAVTRAKVRERSRADYVRYRKWLLETDLADDLSGRIMEYAWHMIFGKGPVHCPHAKQCYCDVYGLCDLTCQNDGVCESQYTLPTYSVMPSGWPDFDWDGKWQNASAM